MRNLPPSIYPGRLIGGDPTFNGFTLGETLVYPNDGVFKRAEWPGVRAIRVGGSSLTLIKDLPDSYPINATGRAYPTGAYGFASASGQRTFTNTGYLSLNALTGGAGTLPAVIVTMPTDTLALITLTAYLGLAGQAQGFVSYKVSGASTIVANDAWSLHLSAKDTAISGTRTRIQVGLTPGVNIFEVQAKVSAGTGTLGAVDLAVNALSPGANVGLFY